MNLLLEFKIVFSAVWVPGWAATGSYTQQLHERDAQQQASLLHEPHDTKAMLEGAS